MGKTFDKHWSNAHEFAATQFAMTVQDWEEQKELPAPFNIIAIVSYTVSYVFGRVCNCSGYVPQVNAPTPSLPSRHQQPHPALLRAHKRMAPQPL